MTRPSEARIDLRALRHNYRLARALHGGRAARAIVSVLTTHWTACCADLP